MEKMENEIETGVEDLGLLLKSLSQVTTLYKGYVGGTWGYIVGRMSDFSKSEADTIWANTAKAINGTALSS